MHAKAHSGNYSSTWEGFGTDAESFESWEGFGTDAESFES